MIYKGILYNMFGKVTVEKMLGSLDGQLGEDDYTEPLIS